MRRSVAPFTSWTMVSAAEWRHPVVRSPATILDSVRFIVIAAAVSVSATR
ncbi:MAG: hypothetical protein ABSD38_32915 [Syntrophorhabdales bacterium]